MKILVNGKETEAKEKSTLWDVIRSQINLESADDAKGIAAALNGTVVPKKDWDSISLSLNDSVEIVHAVQGG